MRYLCVTMSLAVMSLAALCACRQVDQELPDVNKSGKNFNQADRDGGFEGRVFVVDRAAENASDANPGTAAKPLKTLNRAGSAAELRPGDQVFIKERSRKNAFKVKTWRIHE